jgi:hypothetical protein
LRRRTADLEEEAAKRSAEEQRQRTAIDAHDSDAALGSELFQISLASSRSIRSADFALMLWVLMFGQ